MAKNYQSSGLDAVFTATKDYQSGDMVKIGNLLGVTHDNVAEGEQGVAIIEGVFALPKADGVALSQGDIAGYKGATGVIQPIEQLEDGDLTGAGVVVQDADAADETVMLKINTGVGGSGGGKVPVPDGGLTVTVGSGGDYETLGAAIDGVANTYEPSSNSDAIKVKILAGTVLSEQLFFENGHDYSHIRVFGDDAQTTVAASALTQPTEVGGAYGFINVTSGTKSPNFCQAFTFDSNSAPLDEEYGLFVRGHGSLFNGYATDDGAFGIDNTGTNAVLVLNGATAIMHGASITNCQDSRDACHIKYGANLYAHELSVNNNLNNGMEVEENSFADLYYADFSANGGGIQVSYGSRVYASYADFQQGATDATSDIELSEASFMQNYSGSGGSNVTPNTLSADGLLMK